MADTRQRTTLGTRFRFLIRAIGLTGLVAAAVGLTLSATVFSAADLWKPETLRAAGEGAYGQFAKSAALVFAFGLGAVAAALLIEIVGGLLLVTGRRTAASAT